MYDWSPNGFTSEAFDLNADDCLKRFSNVAFRQAKALCVFLYVILHRDRCAAKIE